MQKIKFYLLTIFFALSACETNYSPINIEDCPILFARYYINHAWGYNYNGWYVDKDGKIHEVDINSNLKLETKHDSLFSKKILNELLASSAETNRYLNNDILNKMKSLIDRSSSGQISEQENVCSDFGEIGYYTFKEDVNNNGYRSILLYLAGDWAQNNLSVEAKELFELLRLYVENDTTTLPCAL